MRAVTIAVCVVVAIVGCREPSPEEKAKDRAEEIRIERQAMLRIEAEDMAERLLDALERRGWTRKQAEQRYIEHCNMMNGTDSRTFSEAVDSVIENALPGAMAIDQQQIEMIADQWVELSEGGAQ